MKIRFQGSIYEVVFTTHAKLQMDLRGLNESEVLEVIKTGKVKPKATEGRFWVFKELEGRKDNLVSVSVALEEPNLIVITTMINWRPQ
jgi:hypothetical protein